MKICYFGTYSTGEGYPRNRVIIKGLRLNGVEVVECHKELWKDSDEKLRASESFINVVKILFKALCTYLALMKKFLSISDYNLIIVGYAGHFDIFFIWILNLLNKRKPIVFDAFISLYDTIVQDRRLASPSSLKARFLWVIDKYSCKIADAVILDTNNHIDFFVKEFGLPRKKFIRVFVGEDDEIFRYKQQKDNKKDCCDILFFGTYIPLHGIKYILQAAETLKYDNSLFFTFIGAGHLYKDIKKIAEKRDLTNITFISRWVDYKELTEYIRKTDICLGIFGDTKKAGRVIPCKVFGSMAMGKAIITGLSPAINELLTHRTDVFLCKMADSADLANAIVELKNNAQLRKHIAENCYKVYLSKASPKAVGSTLVSFIKESLLQK